MYKRSSEFLNRSWPGPRTKSRSAVTANAALNEQRKLRAGPMERTRRHLEIEEDYQMLQLLVKKLACDLSASEFLQSLSSEEIERLVPLVRNVAQLTQSTDNHFETGKLERRHAIAYLHPFIENFLSEPPDNSVIKE